jgi:hypothetical protein
MLSDDANDVNCSVIALLIALIFLIRTLSWANNSLFLGSCQYPIVIFNILALLLLNIYLKNLVFCSLEDSIMARYLY